MQARKRTRTNSASRFAVERLEERTLLALIPNAAWPHPERITVSFLPDGTESRTVNVPPSNTWAMVNAAGYDVAQWKKEALRGLQMWAQYANINFVLVSDDGSQLGRAGSTPDYNVQGDVDFGDIRIGMFDLGEGVYGLAAPPPPRQDTEAGDIDLNSYYIDLWSPTGSLAYIMAHEGGHALGLDHNAGSPVMRWSGLPYSLTPDQEDIDDLRSLYGAREHDIYDKGGRGVSRSSPINVTNKLDSQFRYTFNGVDITTPTDRDWYKIRIPAGAGSKLMVRMHTTKLSLLAPRLVLYDGQGNMIKAVNGDYGQTITLWQKVQPGQVYYINATGKGFDEFAVGAYALMFRISNAQPLPVSVPDTATPVDPNAPRGVYDPLLAPGADLDLIEARFGDAVDLDDSTQHRADSEEETLVLEREELGQDNVELRDQVSAADAAIEQVADVPVLDPSVATLLDSSVFSGDRDDGKDSADLDPFAEQLDDLFELAIV